MLRYPSGRVQILILTTGSDGETSVTLPPLEHGPVSVTTEIPRDSGPFGSTPPIVTEVDACIPDDGTGGGGPPPPVLSAAFSEPSVDWGGGYCTSLLVTNTSASPVTDWSVAVDTNAATIATTWNGVFSGSSGQVTIQPQFAWNQTIQAGATDDSIGYCADRDVPNSGTLPFVVGASP